MKLSWKTGPSQSSTVFTLLITISSKYSKSILKRTSKKKHIRPLQLSIGYSILFVSKKDDKFRLYIDYRQFNIIIKKNYYFLLFILKLKDRLFGV